MCGINGFNWKSQESIQLMNKLISHRGPNGGGIFCNDNFSLGHRRLAILDLSESGKQPMEFEGLKIVYNGEVYNFQEIRRELEKLGYTFYSNTDTEVVLKAYHCWKEKSLQKFNGIFAYAILDEKGRTLFMARDRLGVKPLYYYQKENRLIFSSEIKAILSHSNIDKTIVPERISFIYQMNCLPGELTMYKNIHMLPAANWALYKDGRIAKKRYWEINDFEDIKSKEGIIFKIKEILNDSVKINMISDVSLGVFLSGGFDSSIITLLAGKYSRLPVKTYSVGFEVDKNQDEKFNADFYLARKTSKFFGTDHHELFLKKGKALEYVSEKMADNLELPNAMTTAIPSYWLSEIAKKEVSVVLGGDGGDELFGGYPRYNLSFMFSQWLKIPASIRRLVPTKLIGNMLGKKDLHERLNLSSDVERYCTLKLHQGKDVKKVFKNCYNSNLTIDYLNENYFSKKLTGDFEKHFMITDSMTWLTDHSLLRTDKSTMAFGIEQRVPILDYRLVELSAKIPTKYKLNFKDNKIIFKEAFAKELPSHLFNQPKRGWLSPAAKWLRDELKDFSYDVINKNYTQGSEEFIDFKAARKLLDDHIEGKKYNLHLIWILITWQLWYKKCCL